MAVKVFFESRNFMRKCAYVLLRHIKYLHTNIDLLVEESVHGHT